MSYKVFETSAEVLTDALFTKTLCITNLLDVEKYYIIKTEIFNSRKTTPRAATVPK